MAGQGDGQKGMYTYSPREWLQELSHGLGLRDSNVKDKLGEGLRRLLDVENLEPTAISSRAIDFFIGLLDGLEDAEHQLAGQVTLNTLDWPELRSTILDHRRKWLANHDTDWSGLPRGEAKPYAKDGTVRTHMRDKVFPYLEAEILARWYQKFPDETFPLEPKPVNNKRNKQESSTAEGVPIVATQGLHGEDRPSLLTSPDAGASPPPLSLTIQLQQQVRNQELETAITELAEAVRYRLRTEHRLQRADGHLIPVRWINASWSLCDWESVSNQGEPLLLDVTPDSPDRIVETYNAIPSGRLVIIGKPGFGKTTLVTAMTISMLDAERLPYGRVPVIFNLSLWQPTIQSLRDWMTDFLLVTYPDLFDTEQKRKLAGRAVYWDYILPVLDGFDEIPYADQATAMKMLNSSFDRADCFVLTSRTGEYADAVQKSGVLNAATVIELYELAFDDVATYLLRHAKWRSTVERMRYAPGIVRPGLDEDDWGARYLRLALHSPLMVSLAHLAYNGTNADPSDLLDLDRFPSDTAIANHLFGRYLVAAYEQPPQDREIVANPYNCTPEQAQSWLGCIAAYMCGCHSFDLPAWDMQSRMTKLRDVFSYSLLGRQHAAAIIMPVWSKWRPCCRVEYHEKLRQDIRASLALGLYATLWVLGYTWWVTHHVGLYNLRVALVSLGVITIGGFANERLQRRLSWRRPRTEHQMLPIRGSRLSSLLKATTDLFLLESVALLGEWSAFGQLTKDHFILFLPILFAVYEYFDANKPSTYWNAHGPKRSQLRRSKLPRQKLAFLEDAYRRGVLHKNGGMYQFRHSLLQERLASEWIEAQTKRVVKREIIQLAREFITDGCRCLD